MSGLFLHVSGMWGELISYISDRNEALRSSLVGDQRQLSVQWSVFNVL